MKKLFGLLFLGIFALSFCLAVTPDKTSIYLSDSYTQSVISISNTNATSVVNWNLDSAVSGYFQVQSGSFSVPQNGVGSITLNRNSNIQNGVYQGNLIWSSTDGTSGSIPIIIAILNYQQTECKLNPSLVSYTQATQVGTTFDLPTITFNPTGCNGTLSLSTPFVTGGVQTSSGQKPVYIKSASASEIVLGVDTAGLSSKTYNAQLTVTAFGKTFSQISNINIIVTSGTSQDTTFSLQNLPSCALSSTAMSLNSSYSLTCTNIYPDVTIIPQVDSSKVMGLNVDSSSTKYVWYFQPTALGDITIKANFFYQGSPVGAPFSQIVQVGSSGVTNGDGMGFVFTPSLNVAKPGQSILVQVIDNLTGSLVPNALLFIDSLPQTSANGYTFNFSFNPNQNYSFRAVARTYNDLVRTISLASQNMPVNMSTEPFDSDTIVNISTNGVTANIFLDGQKVSNPFTSTIMSGNHSLQIIAEGYFDYNKNFTVYPGLTALLTTTWKQGVSQIIQLSKSVNFELVYQKDSNSQSKVLLNSSSNQVIFTPSDVGIYQLSSNGKVLWSQGINGWDGKILWFMWYWWLIGLVVISFIVYLNSNSSSNSGIGLSGGVNLK